MRRTAEMFLFKLNEMIICRKPFEKQFWLQLVFDDFFLLFSIEIKIPEYCGECGFHSATIFH